uniref:Uncharacterized protein n=1 Tax=Strigamia maritima TaxID=126957 RepID=T1JHF6_STRMM
MQMSGKNRIQGLQICNRVASQFELNSFVTSIGQLPNLNRGNLEEIISGMGSFRAEHEQPSVHELTPRHGLSTGNAQHHCPLSRSSGGEETIKALVSSTTQVANIQSTGHDTSTPTDTSSPSEHEPIRYDTSIQVVTSHYLDHEPSKDKGQT